MKTKLLGFLIAQTSNKQYSSNYSHIAKNARSSRTNIYPLSRTPRALDWTRSALHALCSVHIQCADRKSSVHCMHAAKKQGWDFWGEGARPPRPLGSASDLCSTIVHCLASSSSVVDVLDASSTTSRPPTPPPRPPPPTHTHTNTPVSL